MEDIEFSYIGEEETLDDDLNDDYEVRTVRVNKDGKKIRGKELSWVKKINFNNPTAFEQSNVIEELKDNYTVKRKREYEYATVHNYVCKYFQRSQYLPCQKEIRIVFPADSLEVFVQESGRHEHIENPDFIDKSLGFRWSRLATDTIVMGIQNGATPKVMLRNMRDKNCFSDSDEPTLIQLYNKISHMKNIMNLAEHIENTHQMRQKIENHLEVPDNDIEGYIPYHSIQDDVEQNEKTRFVVIFSTKRLISFLSKSEVLHIDATYRLNWQGYPVIIVGVSSATGKFFGSLSVLSSHEDSEAWSEIYKYIHSLNIHPRFRMSDGAQSITKAGFETFGDCEDCLGSERLMCWSHVHRALVPQLKHLSTLDKNVAKSVLGDIEEIQWSATNENFKTLVNLLEIKYVNNSSYSPEIVAALKLFFKYFQSVWVDSQEHKWYEGSNPFGSSNNQGIEGKNKSIKSSHTFWKKMPLGSFFDVMLRMVHEWSLEDNSLLGAERKNILFSKPDGLKMRSNGYQWYNDHKSNNNYAEIKLQGRNVQTLMKNVSSIWAIPSSQTKQSELALKDIAKQRLSHRFNSSLLTSFDEYLKIRSSCYLVEQIGSEFFCDCYEGMKARVCKHAVGLMYKTGVLEISSDVRSKPLGQKRKRGRPKKLPACLTRSPEPQTVGDIPNASYHAPSPNVSLISSISSSPPVTAATTPPSSPTPPLPPQQQTSPILALATQTIVTRKRARNVIDEHSDTFIDLPPRAKRKSRLRLTFCDATENIKNIDKRTTRSSKRIKK